MRAPHLLIVALAALTLSFGALACEQKAADDAEKTTETEKSGDETAATETDPPTETAATEDATEPDPDATAEADPAASGDTAAGGSTSTIDTDSGPLVVQVLQHGTFALMWDGQTILVDPVADAFANAPALKSLPPATLILVTDIHGDHLDGEQVQKSRAESAPVIAPQAVVDHDQGKAIESPTVIANGESTEPLPGFTITAVPMYNLQRKRPDSGEFFHVKGRGNGYLVEHDGFTVYISGDTECTPEMKALTDVDVAFVTMNLPYTMPIEEAAGCARAFQPGILFPFHHRGQDPYAFAELLKDTPEVEVRVLDWYPASDDPTGESPEE